MSAGKGDKPRPVNREAYEANYDRINWRKGKASVRNRTRGSR